MVNKRRDVYFDEKNQVWVGSIELGRDANGKRIRRKVASKSHAVAIEKLSKLEEEHRNGLVPLKTPEKITIESWMNTWVETDAARSVRQNTLDLYRGLVKKHINSRIGQVLISKVTPLHIEQMFISMERDAVGRRTQQHTYDVLGKALDKAERLELIKRNPVRRVDKPRLDATKKRAKRVWSTEDVHKFLISVSQDRMSAAYVLAVGCGLRRSELLGLQIEYLDLARGLVRIEWGLHERTMKTDRSPNPDKRLAPDLYLLPPKTEASRRTIQLPRSVLTEMTRHVEQNKAAIEASGGFVFTAPEGGPMRPSNFGRSWRRLLSKSGVPHIQFKQLRHTCLTLLAEQGVPLKAAQGLAGHSTPQLTAGVYQQVTTELSRQAADGMDRVLMPVKPLEP